MAYVSTKLYIEEAARAVRVELFFPTDLPEVGTNVRGVITLLHGGSNSGLEWVNLSAAYRYASETGYILICPDAENSFYNNMAYGAPWYTIITEYLPKQLARIFKIPTQREKNHIAGLSMGGYGALRIGLANPNKYATIGAFSGCLDINELLQRDKITPLGDVVTPVFGAAHKAPDEADLFSLVDKAAALPASSRPRIYTTCGLQDVEPYGVLGQNQRFAAHVSKLPLDFTYAERNGVHEWRFWDRSIAEFIGFIEQNDYFAQKQADWAD